MDLLKHFIYSDKRMIFKQHAPLELFKDQLEPRFEIEPTAQFIHLWDEKKYFTRGIQNPNQTKDLYSMYYKPAEDASNILNIKISEFFSTDWHEYSEQFDRLSNFLNLKKPRKNAVRAFMLAYLERNVIFHEEDRGKFFASKKLGWS